MSELAAGVTPNPLTFDDRVDTDPNISSIEALGLIGRYMAFLGHVKLLFGLKFGFAIVAIFPGLVVPWLGKVIIDQVILQKPFGETEVRFPPFMNPFLDFVSGMTPLGIMASIVGLSAVMLLLFGTRGPATGVDMWRTQGHDAATQSEAALSNGKSEVGGLWGLLEFVFSIRLTQRIANNLRIELFGRLTSLPMTTVDDQRIGDSVYRVMYDTPMVPEICFNLTIAPVLAILGMIIAVYLMQYSYGHVAPEIVWIGVLTIPVGLLMTLPMSSIIRKVNQVSRASGAATTNAMEESMENISAVQSLGGMSHETERFEQRSVESFKRHRYAFLLEQAMGALRFGLLALGGAYVAVLIVKKIIDGEMSQGDFMTIFMLFTWQIAFP